MYRTLLSSEALPVVLTGALTLLGAAAVHAEFPEVSKLPSRPDLPDPLVMFDGERVTTKEQWFEKRRPELKALFQHYMYGYLPAAPDKIKAKVEREDAKAFDGKATLKEDHHLLRPAGYAERSTCCSSCPTTARGRRRSSSA